MNEEIFPEIITDNMNVLDYKMVYYNPFDAQYLSYLVVNYNHDDYYKEMLRLNSLKNTRYLGYFGVIGFNDDYELLSIYADSYQGFVYAISPKGEDTIIYVEIIFCNYFMDLDYKEYINENYLPLGFDATSGNEYEKKMMNS